ncbi:MAG: Cupin 2 conserved barrel domain protein [Candidatus Saccharibacteria bacterium]|nr:Cupin 2 conserved barrel domain protein [Candidatus Saccharibacteria bacterium]
MILIKYRWSKHYESAEEELVDILASKKIVAERWHAEEYEEFKPHKHPADKQLWCTEGSIVFKVNDKEITLQTGDALDLPANTVHEAKAGFSGCVCYEYPRIADNPSVEA